MTGIAALLGAAGDDPKPGIDLQMATVLGLPAFGTVTVLIDGATTPVSAQYSWAMAGGEPEYADRVLVGLVGKTLRVFDNLAIGSGYKGGNASGVGPFSSAAPPNGSTGVAFNINRSGVYLFTSSTSAYSSTAGSLLTATTYIGGTSRATGTHFVNPASTHLAFVPWSFGIFLFKGTYYWYQQLTGTGASSDTNDRATLSWVMY